MMHDHARFYRCHPAVTLDYGGAAEALAVFANNGEKARRRGVIFTCPSARFGFRTAPFGR
jgi:hypothetical protein